MTAVIEIIFLKVEVFTRLMHSHILHCFLTQGLMNSSWEYTLIETKQYCPNI